jgi:hypothetical protein
MLRFSEEWMQCKVTVDDFREANKELVLRLVQQRNLGSDSWWVCDEYELRGDKIVARFDERYEEKWTSYKPLVDTPDLFLKFSRLYQAPNFGEAARQFSQRYGLLHKSWQRQQDLSSFHRTAKRAWKVLRLYEAVLNGNARAVESFVSQDLDEDKGLNDDFEIYTALFPEGPEEARWLNFAVFEITFLVDAAVRELCYPALDFEELTFPQDSSKIITTMGFENLLGAMYLQMYWLMTSEGDLARCEYCGRVISLSRPYPEGRKRRRDKRFCNDACRQARHRSKKRASEVRS